MTIHVNKTSLASVLPLRNLFLQENNFQVRYNAVHERGCSDLYFLTYNEINIGYAAIKGNENSADRNTVFEFYITPSFRNIAVPFFSTLLEASGAGFIECQSNDRLLCSLLYQFGNNINCDTILFGDSTSTCLNPEKIIFRKRKDNDIIFEHQSEPEGEWVLEQNKQVIATGGFLLHYNIPFADLYMEVKEDHRKKGLGSFLIQEIKRECYLAGRVPAARCNINNMASRSTLIKAGLQIAGFMLLGSVKNKSSMKSLQHHP